MNSLKKEKLITSNNDDSDDILIYEDLLESSIIKNKNKNKIKLRNFKISQLIKWIKLINFFRKK